MELTNEQLLAFEAKGYRFIDVDRQLWSPDDMAHYINNLPSNIDCGCGMGGDCLANKSNKLKKSLELLPCPFCGGEAEIDGKEFFNIGCVNIDCGMYMVNKVRSCRNKDEAIKAWNTRTEKSK